MKPEEQTGAAPGTDPLPQPPVAGTILPLDPLPTDTEDASATPPVDVAVDSATIDYGRRNPPGVRALIPNVRAEEIGKQVFDQPPLSPTRIPPLPVVVDPETQTATPNVDPLYGQMYAQANVDFINALPKLEQANAKASWRQMLLAAYMTRAKLPSAQISDMIQVSVPFVDTDSWPMAEVDPTKPHTMNINWFRMRGETEDESRAKAINTILALRRERQTVKTMAFLEQLTLNLPRAIKGNRELTQKWLEEGGAFGVDEGTIAQYQTAGMFADALPSAVGGIVGYPIATLSDAVFTATNRTIRAAGLGAVRSVFNSVAKALGPETASALATKPGMTDAIKELSNLLEATGGWVGKDGNVHVAAEAMAGEPGEKIRSLMTFLGDGARQVKQDFKLKLVAHKQPVPLGVRLGSALATGVGIQGAFLAPELVNASPEELAALKDSWREQLAMGIKFPLLMEGATMALGGAAGRLQAGYRGYKGARGEGKGFGESLRTSVSKTPDYIQNALNNIAGKQLAPTEGTEISMNVRPRYLGEAALSKDPTSAIQALLVPPDPEPIPTPSASALTMIGLDVPSEVPQDLATALESNVRLLEDQARLGLDTAAGPANLGLAVVNTRIAAFESDVEMRVQSGQSEPEAIREASVDLLKVSGNWAKIAQDLKTPDGEPMMATPDPLGVSHVDVGSSDPNKRTLAIHRSTSGLTVLAGMLRIGQMKSTFWSRLSHFFGEGRPETQVLPVFLHNGKMVVPSADGIVDVSDSLLPLKIPDTGNVDFVADKHSPVVLDFVRGDDGAGRLKVDAELSIGKEFQRGLLRRAANPKMPGPDTPAQLVYDMTYGANVNTANRDGYKARLADVEANLSQRMAGLDKLIETHAGEQSEEEKALLRNQFEREFLHDRIMVHRAKQLLGESKVDPIDQMIMQQMGTQREVQSVVAPEADKTRVFRLAGERDFQANAEQVLAQALAKKRNIEFIDVDSGLVRDGKGWLAIDDVPNGEMINVKARRNVISPLGIRNRVDLESNGITLETVAAMRGREVRGLYYRIEEAVKESFPDGELKDLTKALVTVKKFPGAKFSRFNGVNAKELEKSGLVEFLEKAAKEKIKVTKQDLMDLVRANRAQLVEVRLSSDPPAAPQLRDPSDPIRLAVEQEMSTLSDRRVSCDIRRRDSRDRVDVMQEEQPSWSTDDTYRVNIHNEVIEQHRLSAEAEKYSIMWWIVSELRVEDTPETLIQEAKAQIEEKWDFYYGPSAEKPTDPHQADLKADEFSGEIEEIRLMFRDRIRAAREEARVLAGGSVSHGKTKWENYQISQSLSDSNYREFLLMLPEDYDVTNFPSAHSTTHWMEAGTPPMTREEAQRVLVHLRVTTRTNAATGEKFLHIHEVQSDMESGTEAAGWLGDKSSKAERFLALHRAFKAAGGANSDSEELLKLFFKSKNVLPYGVLKQLWGSTTAPPGKGTEEAEIVSVEKEADGRTRITFAPISGAVGPGDLRSRYLEDIKLDRGSLNRIEEELDRTRMHILSITPRKPLLLEEHINIAIKRALLLAAEEGLDGIRIASGAATRQMWESKLRQTVKEISISPSPADVNYIDLKVRKAGGTVEDHTIKRHDLKDWCGNETAADMLEELVRKETPPELKPPPRKASSLSPTALYDKVLYKKAHEDIARGLAKRVQKQFPTLFKGFSLLDAAGKRRLIQRLVSAQKQYHALKIYNELWGPQFERGVRVSPVAYEFRQDLGGLKFTAPQETLDLLGKLTGTPWTSEGLLALIKPAMDTAISDPFGMFERTAANAQMAEYGHTPEDFFVLSKPNHWASLLPLTIPQSIGHAPYEMTAQDTGVPSSRRLQGVGDGGDMRVSRADMLALEHMYDTVAESSREVRILVSIAEKLNFPKSVYESWVRIGGEYGAQYVDWDKVPDRIKQAFDIVSKYERKRRDVPDREWAWNTTDPRHAEAGPSDMAILLDTAHHYSYLQGKPGRDADPYGHYYDTPGAVAAQLSHTAALRSAIRTDDAFKVRDSIRAILDPPPSPPSQGLTVTRQASHITIGGAWTYKLYGDLYDDLIADYGIELATQRAAFHTGPGTHALLPAALEKWGRKFGLKLTGAEAPTARDRWIVRLKPGVSYPIDKSSRGTYLPTERLFGSLQDAQEALDLAQRKMAEGGGGTEPVGEIVKLAIPKELSDYAEVPEFSVHSGPLVVGWKIENLDSPDPKEIKITERVLNPAPFAQDQVFHEIFPQFTAGSLDTAYSTELRMTPEDRLRILNEGFYALSRAGRMGAAPDGSLAARVQVRLARKDDVVVGRRIRKGEAVKFSGKHAFDIYSITHPVFKKFFGDWAADPENSSKVVTPDGQPMLVAHGTTARTPSGERFVRFEETTDIGFHFGTEEQASLADYQDDPKFLMYYAYLNIRNPLEVGDQLTWNLRDPSFWQALDNALQGQSHPLFAEELPFSDALGKDMDTREGALWDLRRRVLAEGGMTLKRGDKLDGKARWRAKNHIVRFLQARGYDGIKYLNLAMESSRTGNLDYSWVAFEPDQIMLAAGSGAFEGQIKLTSASKETPTFEFPEAVLEAARRADISPARIEVITPKQRKEYTRRFGLPNTIDVGHGIFGENVGLLFVNDELDGRPVAYIPPKPPVEVRSGRPERKAWEMSRQELSEHVFYHASHGELEGAPRTGHAGFFLASTPDAAKQAGLAGGTLPDLGVSRGTPDTVTPFVLTPEAKVFGKDSSLGPIKLPETIATQEEYSALFRLIEQTKFSDKTSVNDQAVELAKQALLAAYTEIDGVLRLAPEAVESRASGDRPIDLRNNASFAPDWEGFEYEGTFPEALRALGYDAAFVRDEGGLSLVALTDKALRAAPAEAAGVVPESVDLSTPFDSNFERLLGHRQEFRGAPQEDLRIVSTFMNQLIGDGFFNGLSFVNLQGMRRGDPSLLGHYNWENRAITLFLDAIKGRGESLRGTIIHELWHYLSGIVPEKDTQGFDKYFRKARNKFQDENPWFGLIRGKNTLTPDEVELFKAENPAEFDKYTFTDDEGQCHVDWSASPELYQFKSLDEFFVEKMLHLTSKEFDRAMEGQSILARGAIFMKNLWLGLCAKIGVKSAEVLFNNFVAARYSPNTAYRGYSMEDVVRGQGADLSEARRGRRQAAPSMGTTPPLTGANEARLLIGDPSLKSADWGYLNQDERSQHLRTLIWRLAERPSTLSADEFGSSERQVQKLVDQLDKFEPKVDSDGKYAAEAPRAAKSWQPDSARIQDLHDEWSKARSMLTQRLEAVRKLNEKVPVLSHEEIVQLANYGSLEGLSVEEFDKLMGLITGGRVSGEYERSRTLHASLRDLFESGEFDKLPKESQDKVTELVKSLGLQGVANAAQQHAEVLKQFDLAGGDPTWRGQLMRPYRALVARLMQGANVLDAFAKRYMRPDSTVGLRAEFSTPETAKNILRPNAEGVIPAEQNPIYILQKGNEDAHAFLVREANIIRPIVSWLLKQKLDVSSLLYRAIDENHADRVMEIDGLTNIPIPEDIASIIGVRGKTANLAHLVHYFRDTYFPRLMKLAEPELAFKYNVAASAQREAMRTLGGDIMIKLHKVLHGDEFDSVKEYVDNWLISNGLDMPDPKTGRGAIRDLNALRRAPHEDQFAELLNDPEFLKKLDLTHNRSLERAITLWKSNYKMWGHSRAMADDLVGGKRRVEGYAPHAWMERHLLSEVRAAMMSDSSELAAILPSEVRNEFMKRRAGEEGYLKDISVALMLYLPVMAKTIHLDRAWIRSKPLIDQIPNEGLRQIAYDYQRRIAGVADPLSDYVDKYAEAMIMEGGGILGKLPGVKKDIAERPWIYTGRRITEKLGATLGKMLFMGIVDQYRLPLLNVFEHSLLPVAMAGAGGADAVRAIPSWGRSIVSATGTQLRSAVTGDNALGRWVSRQLGVEPWLSDARNNGVVETFQDAALEHASKVVSERTGTQPGLQERLGKLFKAWYWIQFLVDQNERVAGWDMFKRQGIRHGLTQDEAKIYARAQVLRIFGDHSKVGQSPYTYGGLAPTAMLIKRFMLNRLDDLASDIHNSFYAARKRSKPLGLDPVPLQSPALRAQLALQGDESLKLSPEVTYKSAAEMPTPSQNFTNSELETLALMGRPIHEYWWGKRPSPEAVIAARWRVGALMSTLPVFYAVAKVMGTNMLSVLPYFFSAALPMYDWAKEVTKVLGGPPPNTMNARQKAKWWDNWWRAVAMVVPGSSRYFKFIRQKRGALYDAGVKPADVDVLMRRYEDDPIATWVEANFFPLPERFENPEKKFRDQEKELLSRP